MLNPIIIITLQIAYFYNYKMSKSLFGEMMKSKNQVEWGINGMPIVFKIKDSSKE
jgi:hypothetical protein